MDNVEKNASALRQRNVDFEYTVYPGLGHGFLAASLLDYAHAEHQRHLRTVKRGLIEVATARRQLERQAERLRERVTHLEAQARQGLRAGREDLARTALERKQATLRE